MKKDRYDVIVVGASNAGGMAAAAAAEKGAKVLVIDKMGSAGYLYRDTIAALHSHAQQKANVNVDQQELVNFLSTFAQGNVDQRLLNTWAEHSSETVDWLDEEVLRPNGAYIQATPDAYYETERNRAFPTGNEVTSADGKYWELGYGNWVISKAEQLGVEFCWKTALQNLMVQQGKVTGVFVRDVATNQVSTIQANKGVILCTGGYGSNVDLMKKWNPLGLKTNVYTDGQRDDGSGIVAALKIGASKDEEPASIVFNRGAVPVGTNTNNFYEVDLTPPDDPGYLWLGSYPMLKVNLNGERFFNESAPYQFQMNAASKQPGYLSAMIWTEETMSDSYLKQYHTLGCSRLGFPGIFTGAEAREEVADRLKEGLVQKADSIEKLAEQLDIPTKNLVKSVKTYNDYVAKHKDFEFGKESFRLEPVDKAPYYGAIVGGRLLATLDGLRVNTRMQVLDKNDHAIAGLYAAGNCSGGFFWGSYPDHVPGLTASHALTFGRLAGQDAAK
ncbi:fumarate reductase flavoprotein subunit [Secundilactobacillus pentosiphilus]|uniref:Fumarate reductase flavoprotein subunit n=1 Tax=Secundilactobacillus pentosiphilus TaxID=1714682 RepID=A0A1Z5IXL2_9LACO|nr:FAD-binding protein [Secundilactobacillus pentosiphilus]GAX06342.1 fumarate reductase flavoprotein subunit [Secundilactobacillus pentosiphilus]